MKYQSIEESENLIFHCKNEFLKLLTKNEMHKAQCFDLQK